MNDYDFVVLQGKVVVVVVVVVVEYNNYYPKDQFS
jgi:hypothetical protein